MPEPVVLRLHAIKRYRERVKPALGQAAAKEDLQRLMDGAELVDDLDWAYEWGGYHDGFLVLSDGIALVLLHEEGELRAITCLTRAGLSPDHRKARNERRQKRQARRHFTNRNHKQNRGRAA